MKINRRNFLGVVGTGTAALSLDALGATTIDYPGENPDGDGGAVNHTARNRVVILLAHPAYGQSVANKALAEAVKDLPGVTVIDMYAAEFTPETYRLPVAEASALVFQFPFHWLSAPSLLKKWCDEIFGGLADSVKGKKLFVATTTGSEYEAYRSGGRNLFTIDELLRPYQALAHHSGMVWQTPFAVYGASLPTAPASIREGADRYKEIIWSLLI
ncbi:MAG: NAD(P)H-dependent oxidoreductase [Tannerellaceae bacterium]|jgi:glutathione-regulated potassium-efflux system ancillary protein KefG|nr:NAD(P)H-dependent oxidoreductase [Tannerellaceae bacterium]